MGPLKLDGLVPFLIFCGVLIGIAIKATVVFLVPWLWACVKPWLHAIAV